MRMARTELILCCCVAATGVQLVQQITVSSEAETAKVCTRAYMVTANEKSYMLTFSSLKGGFCTCVFPLS